jgi:putative endonuclease
MKPRYKRMLRGMAAHETQAGDPAKAQAGAKVNSAAGAAVWSLYILRCREGSFYTGVTTDIARRLSEHQDGRASRFTRTRRPVVLVYQETCGTRSQALVRECAVKALSRQRKEGLVAKGSAENRRAKNRKHGGRRRVMI